MNDVENLLKDLEGDVAGMRSGYQNLQTELAAANDAIKKIHDANYKLTGQVNDMRRQRLAGGGGGGAGADPKRGRFVSEACARYLAAIAIVGAEKHGKLGHVSERHAVLGRALDSLGMEQRAALTISDIPLPAAYAGEVVELVWMYGQARQFGTVYPLGSGTVNLPRLKTSPAFGFMDMSDPVPEKSPQFENKTFTAQKAGGLVRIPRELEVDSIVQLGQFIARYIAREMAKWEDTVFWTADGSSTYKSMKGAGKAALDAGKNLTLATGGMSANDITITHLRNLRAKVNPQALSTAAYYMNATMEAKLVTFNSTANGKVYLPRGARGAMLDGYPVRWVDVLPVFDLDDHASRLQLVFGDASYHYLGERGDIRIETSADVFFATDEIAIRALERFHVELMATDALAVLQLAAS
jgi:HK97 family phage major capsid protein